MLRAQGLGGRPLALLVTVGVLTLTTTLPWIAGVLLTDVFAGLARAGALSDRAARRRAATWERLGLVVLAALLGRKPQRHAGVAARGFGWRPSRYSWPGAGSCRLRDWHAAPRRSRSAPVLLLAANYVVAGRLAWTPGGIALSFGRMLQDGIVARFLAEHCPDPRFRLCEHRPSYRAMPTSSSGARAFSTGSAASTDWATKCAPS